MVMPPVVAGVDGSEESMRAVEWAACEARRRGAPLRIVSAPDVPARMNAYHADAKTIDAILRGAAASALREAITRVGEVAPGLLVDADMVPGPPALAVTDSGAGALVLVVGARGAGGFAALLLGSVSRYAAMHASCPVIVVRQESGAVHREIAVGVASPGGVAEAGDTGDTEGASATLAFGFEEAARRGAALVAVHSWYWLPLSFDGGAEARAELREAADPEWFAAQASARLTQALRPWQQKYPDVPVRQDVVRGHPAHILATYTSRADLVVIGRHGEVSGTARAIGGVQHALLGHARGPVAVIPVVLASRYQGRPGPWRLADYRRQGETV